MSKHQQKQLQQQRQEQQRAKEEDMITTSGVCCGCRPGRRKWRTRKSWTTSYALRQVRHMRSDKYEDAQVGTDSQWEQCKDDNNNNNNNSETDSMFFFDAVPEELHPDDYPIVFTTKIPHPAPKVSLEEPETLLRQTNFADDVKDNSVRRQESAPIESHRQPSTRFERIIRRPTAEFRKQLERPRVRIPLQGYPGDLTVQELAECQKFLRGLKLLDSGVSEQIYSFRDIEEEPYTICRWLRATKFDADKILKRCEENQPMFDTAKEHDFYPDVSAAMGGAPFSVFLSQYPFLPIGKARNNCPVNYFQIGKLNPEGILALTSSEKLASYFWWSFMHKFKQEIRKAQTRDPDFVRMEGINILDLDGLNASALTQETMDVIKLASKISDFFPETLHCMLILNAPGFFAMMWGVIKKFIDPRTAQRIQVFSSKAKGLAALQELVAPEEIPVDYGGTNTSIKDAFKEEAHDPTLIRQEVQLLHVGRRKTCNDKVHWKIGEKEVLEVSVYTRSVSAAKVSIFWNGNPVASAPSVQCTFEDTSIERPSNPTNNCIVVLDDFCPEVPGEITVEIVDLDNAAKHHSSHSRGCFLLVGNVKHRV